MVPPLIGISVVVTLLSGGCLFISPEVFLSSKVLSDFETMSSSLIPLFRSSMISVGTAFSYFPLSEITALPKVSEPVAVAKSFEVSLGTSELSFFSEFSSFL